MRRTQFSSRVRSAVTIGEFRRTVNKVRSRDDRARSSTSCRSSSIRELRFLLAVWDLVRGSICALIEQWRRKVIRTFRRHEWRAALLFGARDTIKMIILEQTSDGTSAQSLVVQLRTLLVRSRLSL